MTYIIPTLACFLSLFSWDSSAFLVTPRVIGAASTDFYTTNLHGSFFDDLWKGISGGNDGSDKAGNTGTDISSEQKPAEITNENKPEENETEEKLSLAAFQAAKKKQPSQTQIEEDFDGYMMRDAVYEKWGYCFDMEFNRVDSFGFRQLYLNVLPFRLGQKKFRHATELDYLCHLQAIVEILVKYDQLSYVLYQIDDTKKKPRGGTSPLIAVPLRLELTPEQVGEIIGY